MEIPYSLKIFGLPCNFKPFSVRTKSLYLQKWGRLDERKNKGAFILIDKKIETMNEIIRGNDFYSFLKINPAIQIFQESFQRCAEYEKSTSKQWLRIISKEKKRLSNVLTGNCSFAVFTLQIVHDTR